MQEKLLNRLEQLENLGRATLATRSSDGFGGVSVASGKADGFKAASLSFIERVSKYTTKNKRPVKIAKKS